MFNHLLSCVQLLSEAGAAVQGGSAAGAPAVYLPNLLSCVQFLPEADAAVQGGSAAGTPAVLCQAGLLHGGWGPHA